MKRVLLFVVLVASCIVANAQWSIGADVRIAPFGRYGEDHHVGSDIVVNYSVDMPLDFYIMPTIGVFYRGYYSETWMDGGYHSYYDRYHLGLDLTMVGGWKFKIAKGHWSVFTGPRYAYACISKVWNDRLNRNSFDWRIGVSYSPISRITCSAKVDIACLRLDKDSRYSPKQTPTLAFGIAYNF